MEYIFMVILILKQQQEMLICKSNVTAYIEQLQYYHFLYLL